MVTALTFLSSVALELKENVDSLKDHIKFQHILPNEIILLNFYDQRVAPYENIMCTSVKILPVKPDGARLQTPEMLRSRKGVINSSVYWKI